MSDTLMNRTGPALVASIAATRRLEPFGSDAAPFRSTMLLSGLLCGNPAAQLVTSLRTADEVAELFAERDRLRTQIGTYRLAIVDAPTISGTAVVGNELTPTPGRYAGSGNTAVRRREWLRRRDGNVHVLQGDGALKLNDDMVGSEILLQEILAGPGDYVVVVSAPVRVAGK